MLYFRIFFSVAFTYLRILDLSVEFHVENRQKRRRNQIGLGYAQVSVSSRLILVVCLLLALLVYSNKRKGA